MNILIADDTPELLSLLESVLTRQGHTVAACKNGEEALRVYTKEGGFDYVITDYQMPKKNGVVLIMDIRKGNREQKCILVSGDPPQITNIIREEAGEFPILRKPYSNAALLALLT